MLGITFYSPDTWHSYDQAPGNSQTSDLCVCRVVIHLHIGILYNKYSIVIIYHFTLFTFEDY